MAIRVLCGIVGFGLLILCFKLALAHYRAWHWRKIERSSHERECQDLHLRLCRLVDKLCYAMLRAGGFGLTFAEEDSLEAANDDCRRRIREIDAARLQLRAMSDLDANSRVKAVVAINAELRELDRFIAELCERVEAIRREERCKPSEDDDNGLILFM